MKSPVATYEVVELGIGYFPGRVCDHDWCTGHVPSVAYVQPPGSRGGYLCVRHLTHLVEQVANFHREH